MLKEHKNSWLNTIRNSGIDLSIFDSWNEGDLGIVFQLKHSSLKFFVSQYPDNFDAFRVNHSLYKPGYPLWKSNDEFIADRSVYTPDQVNQLLKNWLSTVVERYLYENEAPNLWANIKDYSTFSKSTTFDEEDLEPFTESEKSQINSGIEDFRKKVTENFELLQDQLEIINDRLDYLKSAVERLNRIDWKAQALSTFISIAVNLGVDTEKGKLLFSLFKRALYSIVGLLPPSL